MVATNQQVEYPHPWYASKLHTQRQIALHPKPDWATKLELTMPTQFYGHKDELRSKNYEALASAFITNPQTMESLTDIHEVLTTNTPNQSYAHP